MPREADTSPFREAEEVLQLHPTIQEDSKRIVTPLRSMSDKKIAIEFVDIFNRHPKGSMDLDRRARLSRAEKLLQVEKGSVESAPVKRK